MVKCSKFSQPPLLCLLSGLVPHRACERALSVSPKCARTHATNTIFSTVHPGVCVPYLKELLGELLVHDLLGRVLLGRRGEEAAEDGVDAALLHQSPGTAGFRFEGHQISIFALRRLIF